MFTHPWGGRALVCVAFLGLGCPKPSETEDAGNNSSSSSSSGGAQDAGLSDAGVLRPDAGRRDAGVDAGVAITACSPALTLAPDRMGVLPLDLATFVATGGTGAYRFAITRDSTGAIVNSLTGAYLSGSNLGDAGRATDEVTVTDMGCTGNATAGITVVPPMKVAPTSVELAPSRTFRFEVTDGLGPFTFEMQSSTAGGMVASDGTYTASTGQGRDVVRVRDTGGGQFVDAIINVVSGTVLTPQQGTLFVPVGATFKPVVRGGSGHFTGTVTGSSASFENDVITGVSAGTSAVNLDDRFTGEMTTVNVVTVAPQQAPTSRAGDQTSIAWVTAAGDVTGDGKPDALLGVPELDFYGVDTGAVYLFKGNATGLDPTPLHVYAPQGRRDNYGRAMAVADINGDGVKDLLVGAPLTDVGLVDNGAVYIHYGLSSDGGTPEVPWEDAPSLVLSGKNAGDQFGVSLALCDFNGDSRLDLAVGAPLAEDRGLTPQPTDQGAVYIYLGYPDGFLPQPDVLIFGQLPDANGVWQPKAGLNLGNALAGGDLDNDMLCDLIIQSNAYKATSTRANDGAIFVHKGLAPNSMGSGGVLTLPSRAWASSLDADPNSQFGRYLATGDVNGDGVMDVVASQYLHDKAAATTDTGAVRVFLGGTMLPTMPTATILGADTSDWVAEGPNAGDNLAWWVATGDVDGDGHTDILTGNLNGEVVDGGPANAGSVTGFLGGMNTLPATTPRMARQGASAGDRFGQNAVVLGELDGDTHPDLLVFAGRGDLYGLDVGVPYFVPGDPARPAVPLEMPGGPSGQQLGRDADVVGDVNGDGLADLVVGAPNADSLTAGINAGVAHLYLGTATGFEASPALTLSGFTGHGGGDQLGFAVSRAGDFDGDGVADFAVLARSDDRPATFDANYVQDGTCTGTRNDSGAVFVFRGKATGLPDNKPAFVFYGPQAGQVMEGLAGGMDTNHDGKADLALTSVNWDDGTTNNVGGVTVVLGRAADPGGKILVMCDAAFLLLGLAANDNVGRSVAAVGDLNGDGCDEIVVGSALEDLGKTDQGSVRVVFGAGAGCSAMTPEAVLFTPDVAGAQAGFSVAGGQDVDGDGVKDLAVGGVGVRSGANTVGGAWVVPGAYVASLPRVAWTATTVANVHPLVDPARPGTFQLLGTLNNERFGSGVALVPRLGGGGRAALAVGSPQGGPGGPVLSGGAQAFSFLTTGPADSRGLQANPVAALGGETARLMGRVGENLRAGACGTGGNRPVMAVGAYEASGVARDEGTTYAVVLTAPP